MKRRDLEDRVLGCIVGASIGDAVGGPFEFQNRNSLQNRIGRDWIDDIYDYGRKNPSAYSVWSRDPPAGTGTDDTRMNHIFLEAVIENRRTTSAQRLAAEYIRRYLHPERFYPISVVQYAKEHLVAANHRDVDESGSLVRFRDNDCTGYVTGALAGAIAGSRKLPADWIDKVIASN